MQSRLKKYFCLYILFVFFFGTANVWGIEIPQGTKIYLDLSNNPDWAPATGYVVSALFSNAPGSPSPTWDHLDVPMSPVPDEPNMWEVDAPAGTTAIPAPYGYVSFATYANATNQATKDYTYWGKWVLNLTWDGKRSIYVIPQKDPSFWAYFLPMPTTEPSDAMSDLPIVEYRLCPYFSTRLYLTAPASDDPDVVYQWYRYEKGTKWKHITSNSQIVKPFVRASDSTGYFYYVEQLYGPELVLCGEFVRCPPGGYGFTSEYTDYLSGSTHTSKMYDILHRSDRLISRAPNITPGHTSGGGADNMMVVDGADDPSSYFWAQSASVETNTEYVFSAWIAKVGNEEAEIDFRINGVSIGTSHKTAAYKSGNWVQWTGRWNSGSSTTAELKMYQTRVQGTSSIDNGFVIDDISFKKITEHKYLYRYVFDINRCFKKEEPERCVILPDNQTDLKQMMDVDIIKGRFGEYNPRSSRYEPTNNITVANVDEFVSIRNTIGETDSYNNSLPTIDSGFISSVRLGYQTYNTAYGVVELSSEINIDPQRPIVNFHVAGILRGMGTSTPMMPSDILNEHFLNISFLDERDSVINDSCIILNIANWDYESSKGYFIPWTSLSFDFSDFVLSDIKKVRFRNYSGQSSSVFSYFYISSRCLKKEIAHTVYCGDFPDSVKLIAPEGFKYLWITGDVGLEGVGVISGASKGREFSINTANSKFTLSYWTPGTDTFRCYHNLHYSASTRFPIADFEVTNINGLCGDTIVFDDRSYVATTQTGRDDVTGQSTRITDLPGEQCEKVMWRIASEEAGYYEEFASYTRDTTFYRLFLRPGTYTVSATAILSTCNHVKETTFIVNTPKTAKRTYLYETICEGSYYEFFGKHLYHSGEYSHNLIAQDGCDSIVTLILNTAPAYYFYEYDTIHYYTDISTKPNLAKYTISAISSGTYYYTKTTKYNCDSIYTLNLYVYPHITFTSNISICENELPFVWHNVSYPSNYIGYPTPTTITATQNYFTNDTDFTETLNLTILPTKDEIKHYYMCEGQTVSINGASISKDTTVYEYNTNSNGCVIRTQHIVHQEMPTVTYHPTRTICNGDTFVWIFADGRVTRNLTTAGLHEYRRPSSNPGVSACDTIDRIQINMRPVKKENKIIYICPNDSILLADGKWHTKGNYTVTVKDTLGCDSTIFYHIREYQMSEYEIDVTSCANEELVIAGLKITQSGQYTDTLKSRSGCLDSIVTYNVTVIPIVRDTFNIRLCKGEESVYIRDGVVVHTGFSSLTEYHDTVYDEFGCDRIRVYYITQGVDHVYEETRTICEGDTLDWRRGRYWSIGTYTDTVHSSELGGCDTIYVLCLRKAEVRYSDSTIYTCANVPVRVEDSVFTREGAYTIVSRSVLGCDSIIRVRVFHKPTYYYVIKDTVCEGDVYYFNGRGIVQQVGDSVYFDRYTVMSGMYPGCDSIYELRLHVNRSADTMIYDTICYGEYVQLGDRYLSHTGVYTYDCVSDVTGCDSLVTLFLMVMPTFKSETLTVYLCDDSVYHFGPVGEDTLITMPGIYTRHYRTRYGCDSSSTVRVIRSHTYYKADTVTICSGERYNFYGKEYYETGVYYDSSLTVVGGCDSVHVLDLTVHRSYYGDTIRVHVCSGSHYVVKGHELYPPVTYWDTNHTIRGCDSIVTYIVNRGDEFVYEDAPVHLCDGEMYEWTTPWNRFEIRSAGLYADTMRVDRGAYAVGNDCDSIYRIRVYEESIRKTFIDTTICPDDSIRFSNVMISDTGLYYDTLRSYPYGCDSIVQLHLFHYPSYYHAYRETICANETYVFNGRLVNQDSVYYDYYPTVMGCDSVFRLELEVLDTDIVYIRDTICIGSLYHFGDTTLMTTGTYRYTTKNVKFCDSTTILDLTVMPKPVTSEVVYLCEYSTYWHYDVKSSGDSVRDTVIATPGVYYRHFLSQFGCDSTHILDVRLVPRYRHYDTVHICFGEEYVFHDKVYNRSGDYEYKEPSHHGGCDSIDSLHLVVEDVYRDTVLMMLCPGSSYTFKGKELVPPTTYVDSNLTVAGCDSIRWYIINSGASHRYDTTVVRCDRERVYRWYPWEHVLSASRVERGRYKDVRRDGIYEDTLLSSLGRSCDTISRLHFRIVPTRHVIIDTMICPSDSVKFGRYADGRDRYVRARGSYFDTLSYINVGYRHECDSVVELRVYHRPQYSFYREEVICDNESYRFNGREVYWDSVYVDSFYTVLYGCDSIYTLDLHVEKTDTTIIDDTICDGQTYQFGDTVLTTTGRYIYTTKNKKSSHCDSTITLDLIVLPNKQRDSFVYLCYGDTFQLTDLSGDTSITTDGTYIRNVSTLYNWCDSFIYYHVHFYPSYYREDTIIICSDEKYLLPGGKYVNRPGIYYDSAKSIHGCDSIVKTRLVVNRSYHDTVRMHFCQGGNVQIGEKRYINLDTIASSCMFTDSFITITGCDSLITYIINISEEVRFIQEINLCQGQSYIWDDTRQLFPYGRNHNRIIKYAGKYFDTIKTSLGNQCDTIFELHVHIQPTYYVVHDTTVCPSVYININDEKIYDEGDYTISSTSSCGCDSIVVWRVRHYATYHYDRYESLCQGDSFVYTYKIKGKDGGLREMYEVFRDDTVRTMKGMTSCGCDSTVELHIDVHPTFIDTFRHYLCPNETFFVRDSLVYSNFGGQNGIFCDTFVSSAGCDSIQVHLFIGLSNYLYDSVVTICANETLLWRGKPLVNPGIYYDSLKTISSPVACDSVYRLTLIHKEVKYIKREVYICNNDYFDLLGNGKKLVNVDGTYIDTIPSMNGCDSIIETRLHVYETFFKEDTVDLCDGDSLWTGSHFIYARDVLQSPDSVLEMYDSLLTVDNLCDSVYFFRIRLRKVYRNFIDLPLCPYTEYAIRDNLVLHSPQNQESYVYYDTLVSVNFCDSINIYKVVGLESYIHTKEVKFCKTRDSVDYIWEVGPYTERILSVGTYEKRFTAQNGCDSVERLKVSYYDIPIRVIFDTVCWGDRYLFHGRFVDTAGIYRDTFPGDKCDSVLELHLANWRVYHDTIYDTICDNEYYHIAGEKVTARYDSMFIFNLSTIHHCDSIIYLFLKVHPTYYREKKYDICPNMSIKLKDTILTFYESHAMASHPYLYNDTMNSVYGCDSVEQYIITVHPKYLFLENVIRCDGDSFLWVDQLGNDRYITEQGVYADTFKTKYGCDSIVGINFIQARTANIHVFDTIWCTNKNYVWRNNKTYSQTGVYVDSLRSEQGCDSVVHLHLQVYRPYLHRVRDTICENERYWFKGQFYNTSGTYCDSAKSIYGCDSVTMIELRVVPVIRDTFSDTICAGETLVWGDKLCTADGEYFDTVHTPGELYCHANVLYLRVLTRRDSRLLFDSIADICADDTSFDIFNRHQGYKPIRFNIIFDQKAKEQGFKDIMFHHYTGKITCPLPKHYDKSYIYPDWYTFTYKAFYDEECYPEVDEYKIRFRILYPSWILEQNWGDVVALLNSEHNGGFSFDNYIWYVNDRMIPEMTGSNLYYQKMGVGDEVYLIPQRTGDDYAIPTCPIVIRQFDSVQNQIRVLIYPTIISRVNAKVSIDSKIDGHYAIFDMYGHRLADAEFTKGKQNVQFPNIAGCYLLYIETADGKKKSSKIMVY